MIGTLIKMKQKTGVFAAMTAALFLGGTMGVGCGGRIAPPESDGTGGSGGTGGTSGSAGNDGTGGSTGGVGGTGGSTGATGGSTGGVGGTGGSTGGNGGAAGNGGTAGSAGGAGAIVCGASICPPITGTPLGNLQPCCPPGSLNTCGAIVPTAGGTCFTSTPGVVDSTCPTVNVMGIALPGCCRPNGLCGVSVSVISLGCNDPTLVGGAPAGPCGADGG